MTAYKVTSITVAVRHLNIYILDSYSTHLISKCCISLQGMPYVEELAEKAGEGSGAFLQKKVTSMHVHVYALQLHVCSYKETRMVWTLFTF